MLLCIVHAQKVCVFVCVDDEYDKSVDGVCMIDDIYVYEIHCMTYSVCVGGCHRTVTVTVTVTVRGVLIVLILNEDYRSSSTYEK